VVRTLLESAFLTRLRDISTRTLASDVLLSAVRRPSVEGRPWMTATYKTRSYSVILKFVLHFQVRIHLLLSKVLLLKINRISSNVLKTLLLHMIDICHILLD
jgi:hypothetical protein